MRPCNEKQSNVCDSRHLRRVFMVIEGDSSAGCTEGMSGMPAEPPGPITKYNMMTIVTHTATAAIRPTVVGVDVSKW